MLDEEPKDEGFIIQECAEKIIKDMKANYADKDLKNLICARIRDLTKEHYIFDDGYPSDGLNQYRCGC